MSSGKKIADYINVETIDLNLKAKNKNVARYFPSKQDILQKPSKLFKKYETLWNHY